MTSRQRVQTALAHQQPDRIPVDFGSTAVTGMHVSRVGELRDYFGLEKRPVKVHEPYQMLGWIDNDLADVLGLDVTGVFPRGTHFGFANENWKTWRTPWGQEVLVSGHFQTSVDDNGDVLIYPQGDTSAPASGKMPKGGFFFDTIVRQPPIEEDKLNPEDNLEEFGPIDEDGLEHLRKEVLRASETSRAVMATFGGTALGDIALVPAPFLKYPKGIRDIAEWYISTATRQDYIHEVFSKQVEIALSNLERIHGVVGDAVDAVFICGTDFGTQTSSFCSVDTFHQLYHPYYKKINDWIHQNTSWKTFKHSCGAVRPFIEAFIEAGFDILNPVQCTATGMEAEGLKDNHGDRLTFWGGGVDTQGVLHFGEPQEVREQVLKRCQTFGQGGGFIFNAIHNIQANVPLKNILAMFEAVHEFNGSG